MKRIFVKRLFYCHLLKHFLIYFQSSKMLDEEASCDSQLSEQFKERWTRTPSQKLTGPMRNEASKYRQILNNAIQADKIVQEKFNKHKEAIMLLTKPEVRKISNHLPSMQTSYFLIIWISVSQTDINPFASRWLFSFSFSIILVEWANYFQKNLFIYITLTSIL